jgi:hypothetical protein
MAAPAKLRNIGPKSAAQLRQVGVRSLDDLRAAGSLETFVKLKRAGFKPSLNLLYAMEGALLDCHWQQIPEERRSDLILAADAATAALPKAQPRWFSGARQSASATSDGASPAEDRDSDTDTEAGDHADSGGDSSD